MSLRSREALLMKALLVVACSSLLVACPDRKAATPPPAADGGTLPADGASEAPVDVSTLVVRLASELPDGGSQVVASPTEEAAAVEPTQTLLLSTNIALRNLRVRVLDDDEKLQESDDVQDDGPRGLQYRIQLKSPLEPGSRYTVVLEPQSGTALEAPDGREFPEQRLSFTTSGTKPEPPPPAEEPKAKRRRRR
jgi:hypothetical protein